MNFFTYECIHQEALGAFITKINLKALSQPLHYEAGQYIKVLHADNTFSPLSIASAPSNQSIIELHLSHLPENKPAADILTTLKNEKKLSLQGPYGSCVFSKLDLARPIIFYVRETGFAPVKAIIEKCIFEKSFPAMHLYWSGENYLASLAESLVNDHPNMRYTQLTANTILEKISADYPDLTHYQFYVVEARNVVHKLFPVLMKQGIISKDFYSDV